VKMTSAIQAIELRLSPVLNQRPIAGPSFALHVELADRIVAEAAAVGKTISVADALGAAERVADSISRSHMLNSAEEKARFFIDGYLKSLSRRD
ncbi:MAG: hypothetical protein JWM57_3005, partial [Phycisphaerales bacterium]|nr:hypothetical protein [Phycisphaerales bacterium]